MAAPRYMTKGRGGTGEINEDSMIAVVPPACPPALQPFDALPPTKTLRRSPLPTRLATRSGSTPVRPAALKTSGAVGQAAARKMRDRT
jgi:hypothetical protein